MKKIILLAVVLFTIGSANAQKAQFGLKGGLNIANLNFKSETPSTSLVGINIGCFLDLKISGKFSIQPEVLYSTQGASIGVETEGVTINSFELNYINVPVIAKYYAAKNFSLEAGPQIGFLTKSTVNGTASGVTVDVDAKQLFKSIDFGLNVGAGYDFTKKLSASLRYNFGFSNIGSEEFTSDGDKITNAVFSINLGYKL